MGRKKGTEPLAQTAQLSWSGQKQGAWVESQRKAQLWGLGFPGRDWPRLEDGETHGPRSPLQHSQALGSTHGQLRALNQTARGQKTGAGPPGPSWLVISDLELSLQQPGCRPGPSEAAWLVRGSGEGPLSSCRQNSSTPSKHRRGPQGAWAPPPEARGPASVGRAADGEGSFLPTGGSHLRGPQWRPSGGSDSH